MNQDSSQADKVPKTPRGRRTREKLLEAAEIEFGERGYHDAAISGITGRAGVALGTFYVYFDSKEAIFRDLVGYMGHLTRKRIAERVADVPDRVTAERRGLETFIEFVREHRNLYRIVSEAQFVAEDAFRDYYGVFAEAYRGHLEAAASEGNMSRGDYESWAWALIGMNVFIGMRYGVWDDGRDAGEIADSVAELLRGVFQAPKA